MTLYLRVPSSITRSTASAFSLRVPCPCMSACAHVCACVRLFCRPASRVCTCPGVYVRVYVCSRRVSGWTACPSWSRTRWRGRCWWSTTSPAPFSTTTHLRPSAKTARATCKRYPPPQTLLRTPNTPEDDSPKKQNCRHLLSLIDVAFCRPVLKREFATVYRA